MAIIDVQDDKEVVILTEDNKVTVTKDEVGNLVKDTSSEQKLSN